MKRMLPLLPALLALAALPLGAQSGVEKASGCDAKPKPECCEEAVTAAPGAGKAPCPDGRLVIAVGEATAAPTVRPVEAPAITVLAEDAPCPCDQCETCCACCPYKGRGKGKARGFTTRLHPMMPLVTGLGGGAADLGGKPGDTGTVKIEIFVNGKKVHASSHGAAGSKKKKAHLRSLIFSTSEKDTKADKKQRKEKKRSKRKPTILFKGTKKGTGDACEGCGDQEKDSSKQPSLMLRLQEGKGRVETVPSPKAGSARSAAKDVRRLQKQLESLRKDLQKLEKALDKHEKKRRMQ